MSPLKHILICEDENSIREFIIVNLKRSDFKVTATSTGEEAVQIFNKMNDQIDIAILDVMLPGINGFEVLKKIRKTNANIGIIMLTAKTQEMDRVKGLNLGADDYLTKPFSPSELIARIDALLRRINKIKQNSKNVAVLKSGPFILNVKNQILTKNGVRIELTQIENQLMNLMLTHPKESISRTVILETIWGENYYADFKIIDVNIRRLRIKIEDDPSNPIFLQTIWGFGYTWTTDVTSIEN